jgi:hypothetical protein
LRQDPSNGGNIKNQIETRKKTQLLAKLRPRGERSEDCRHYDPHCVCILPGKDDIFGDSLQHVYLGCELAHCTSFSKLRQSATANNVVGKSVFSVRALSYCDLHKIGIEDLCAILDVYPEFAGDFLQKFTVTFNLRKVCSLAAYGFETRAHALSRVSEKVCVGF